MSHLEEARRLRAVTERHYNCCQSVIIPFAAECGIDAGTADRLGTYFNAGMRCGATCGAVSGGLMVLGLAGKDEAAMREFRRRFQERNSCTECAQLLKIAREKGEERKPHCDRMVFDAVEFLDELL